jgi:hypothetical protein
MAGLNLDLQIGTSRLWPLQCLNNDDSIPLNLFLAGDVLQAKLWQGANTLAVLTKSPPDVAWISAPNAQFSILFHPGDTLALKAGVYYVEATATRGAEVAGLLPTGSTVTLAPVPGLATARPTYIDIADLRRIAPWIETVQSPDAETGFAGQCADGRDWLDECCLRNYRGGNVSLLGEHGNALDAWFTGGTRRTSLRNLWLLNLLQLGPAAVGTAGLIVTARTRDVCGYYALHRICEGMITRGTQYPALSARMLHKAHQLLVSYTAEISVAGQADVDGNLIANVPINFSSTNSLWA